MSIVVLDVRCCLVDLPSSPYISPLAGAVGAPPGPRLILPDPPEASASLTEDFRMDIIRPNLRDFMKLLDLLYFTIRSKLQVTTYYIYINKSPKPNGR